MKNTIKAVLIAVIAISIVSCASRKKIVYFQDVDSKEFKEVANYSPVFKADDQLSITVSSIDNLAAAPYNLPVASFNTEGSQTAGNQALQTYIIAKDGTVNFPQLGKLHLAGLTRVEAVAMIQKKLKPFLKEPLVNIRLLNFKVTVLGEVFKSGSFSVNTERISILDAIGMAGDLNIYGMRNNVLVIREANGAKEFHRVDLTASDVFDSPAYYLQQNDVVYVEPNKPKINSSINSSANGLIISTVSLLLTVISIFLR
ncbi:polysaccharide biosynthesis/export family protein [Bacteroidota bacterium]